MKTKTVSELAELFGVTRQAMNKRVKSLDTKFVEKNEKNVTVVNAEGINELEGLYGKVVTAKAEVLEENTDKGSEIAIKADDATSAAYEMISALMKDKNAEIERLNSQLISKDQQINVKDAQIAEKDEQIKKQQELMEKALTDQNQFFTDLQEQLKTTENKGFFGRLFGKK
ncbi:DUF536 domain-containing protein [Lactococcus cremoris]|uniref:DUF536 domain-containing protein n=1 Tax=Lactococcus lactis subsp. cremoris TaxID=1359 RepID=UPI0024A6B489|nr:DUF536 domain-containing protein [Lactococcus cremoris]